MTVGTLKRSWFVCGYEEMHPNNIRKKNFILINILH